MKNLQTSTMVLIGCAVIVTENGYITCPAHNIKVRE